MDDYKWMAPPADCAPDIKTCLEFSCPLQKKDLYAIIFTPQFERWYFQIMGLGSVIQLGVVENSSHETVYINRVQITKGELLSSLMRIASWVVREDLMSYDTEVCRIDDSHTINSNTQPRNRTYFLAVKVSVSAHSDLEHACFVAFNSQLWLSLGKVGNFLKPPLLAAISRWIQGAVVKEVSGMLAFARVYSDNQVRTADSDGLEFKPTAELDTQLKKAYDAVVLLSSNTSTGKLE